MYDFDRLCSIYRLLSNADIQGMQEEVTKPFILVIQDAFLTNCLHWVLSSLAIIGNVFAIFVYTGTVL